MNCEPFLVDLSTRICTDADDSSAISSKRIYQTLGKSYELSPVGQSLNFLQEDSPFAPRIQSSTEWPKVYRWKAGGVHLKYEFGRLDGQQTNSTSIHGCLYFKPLSKPRNGLK